MSDPARDIVIANNAAAEDAEESDTEVAALAGSIGGLYKIAEQTLLSAAATIDFTAIPADYSTLVLDCSLRASVAATLATVDLVFNNDTTDANYRHQGFQSANTTSSAAQNIGAANVRGVVFATGASSSAGDFADLGIEIPGYTRADRTKIAKMENQAMFSRTSGNILLRRGMLAWLSNSVVNRLTLVASGTTFAAGSSASLYGRKSATPT